MAGGRVRETPTGYGVIKVPARKQIIVPKVDAATAIHPVTPSRVPRRRIGSVRVLARAQRARRAH